MKRVDITTLLADLRHSDNPRVQQLLAEFSERVEALRRIAYRDGCYTGNQMSHIALEAL